ncbi:DUF1540 domain-containing protein [Rothia uropygialis]|uniref:DUF1540 domain-containing protein n=1 Tax=Kocuria sp. 36 TaxID=1415402 RepID=UPI00101C8DCD|nr:DUF1540 domain-containing protein [Kocuria sp. 36]
MSVMTDVAECTVSNCSFNHDGCTAFAVTITGEPQDASCGTFISLDADGGLPRAQAHVGACQRIECFFNKDLMCGAESVKVGSATSGADCLTYRPA